MSGAEPQPQTLLGRFVRNSVRCYVCFSALWKLDVRESPVREDNKPGLAADSGYGPPLWAEELDIPRNSGSYDEMPDRPCSRRGGTVVCYIGAQCGARTHYLEIKICQKYKKYNCGW